MSSTIDEGFVTKWEGEAKHAFGESKSYLRDAVRVRRSQSQTITFHKIAKGTAILDKARHADLSPMDVAHSTVSLTMGTIHSPEWIDDMDAVRTNLDLRNEYTTSVTRATNEALDIKVLSALNASANTVTGAALDKAGLIAMSKQLNTQNVPHDGKRFLVTHSGGLEDLLSDTTLTSRDYIEKQALETGFVQNLMGFNIIVMPDDVIGHATVEAVDAPTASRTFNYAFHMDAIGLGFAMDFKFDVERLAVKDAWQVMAKMAAGSVIIDATGVCKLDVAD
jgi:hypothetical protein